MKNISKIQTKGQLEDRIAKATTKFYVRKLGVGPREIQVYIIQDMIIIRLQGELLPIEKILLKSVSGISLVKDLRKIIHELTVNSLSEIIYEITNHRPISSHSDISTKTGEIIQVYIIGADLENVLSKKLQEG